MAKAPKSRAAGPYICDLCNKSFSRSDVVTRHKNNVHLSKKLPTGHPSRRKSCSYCVFSKLKCSGGVPCDNCRKRGVDCEPGPAAHNTSNHYSASSTSASPRQSISGPLNHIYNDPRNIHSGSMTDSRGLPLTHPRYNESLEDQSGRGIPLNILPPTPGNSLYFGDDHIQNYGPYYPAQPPHHHSSMANHPGLMLNQPIMAPGLPLAPGMAPGYGWSEMLPTSSGSLSGSISGSSVTGNVIGNIIGASDDVTTTNTTGTTTTNSELQRDASLSFASASSSRASESSTNTTISSSISSSGSGYTSTPYNSYDIHNLYQIPQAQDYRTRLGPIASSYAYTQYPIPERHASLEDPKYSSDYYTQAMYAHPATGKMPYHSGGAKQTSSYMPVQQKEYLHQYQQHQHQHQHQLPPPAPATKGVISPPLSHRVATPQQQQQQQQQQYFSLEDTHNTSNTKNSSSAPSTTSSADTTKTGNIDLRGLPEDMKDGLQHDMQDNMKPLEPEHSAVASSTIGGASNTSGQTSG